MAKDTYCVGRTDTHVNNKQTFGHTHTHTTSASVGIRVCPVSVRVCVILRDTFVSA